MAGIPNIDIDPPKYGPPNMAAQLFGMISSLPDAYQQGVKGKFERGQMARTEKLQEPINLENGQLDYSSLVQKYLQAKGTEAIPDVLPNAWKTQALQNDQPTPSPYSPSNPNMTPDAHTGRAGRVGENDQPQGPAGENPTHQNIRQLAINAGIDPQSDAFRQAFAGTNIDRDFTSPLQAAGAARRLQMLSQGDAGPAAPTAALGGGQGTMYMPGPGMQGAPQPGQPGQPPVQMTQAAPGPQMAQAGQPVPGGAAGMVPPGVDPRAYAQRLKQAAEGVRDKARREGIVGIPSKALEDKAAAFDKTADDILKEIGEAGRPTGEMKNAASPVVQQSKGLEVAQKQELTRGDALQKGVQGAAREYETALKPHLDAMRGILNNPNFVSGAGVGLQEVWNKLRSSPLASALPGYDPNASLPNEALRKVVAASILNQTTELKAEAAEMGGSAGRLFQQQISLMEKAAQNPENTAPALRYLTELQTRMGDHASGIAELANNYQGKYGKGVLDNGFNEVLSKYNRENPIFKETEIKDMRRFAPPPAPAFHTKEDAIAWSRKNNIPPGDPIKMPSGNIIAAP